MVNPLLYHNIDNNSEIERFESIVRTNIGRKYCLSTSSGTAALHLSLLALGIKQGDIVMVPDYTFPAVANVVEMTGAEPRFVDVNLDTFNISIDDLKKKWSTKTKGIICVDQFGLAADFRSLLRLARERDAYLIEDAAAGLGAEYHGRKCGSFGDVSVLSFGRDKIISTGEGGMALTNDEKIAERLKGLRNHGLFKKRGQVDFFSAGLNCRMAPVIAYLASRQLNRLESEVRRRNRIADLYDRALRSYLRVPAVPKGLRHAYQSYVVVNRSSIDSDELHRILSREGIKLTFPAYALHRVHYYWKKYHTADSLLPGSTYAFSSSFALPINKSVTAKDVNRIKTVFSKLKKRRSLV